MTYYRIAFYHHRAIQWNWKTTVLTTLQAVFQLLRSYSILSPDHIRIFTAASKEDLQEMLRRENIGLPSGSVTAAQFAQEKNLHLREQAQGVSEHAAAGPGGRRPTATLLRDHGSITEFPGSNGSSWLNQKRLLIEWGPGGDHDMPYRFTLPVSMQELHAWIHLQSRIQAGELES